MLLPQFPLAKNKLIITYKLLGDLLFLLLLFFALALVADGLIPGIVSTHISFLKIISLIALSLIALYTIGYLAQIKITAERPNKKTTIFLVVISTLLIGNGLFKLNHYLAFSILAITLVCVFFLWRMFFEK